LLPVANPRHLAAPQFGIRSGGFPAMKLSSLFAGTVALALLALAPGHAQTTGPISIDTSNPSDWKISNGVLTVDWLPSDGRIFSMHWSAFPNQEIIDQTNANRNGPKGFYMDNV